MGMPAPAVSPNLRLGPFELSLYRSTRSTTMLRGIAIALFGMSIFSQLDRTFFYGRNTDAALRLAREIGRGFGLG
jgi:hypothetical protein